MSLPVRDTPASGAETPAPSAAGAGSTVSVRSVLLGLALTVPNTLWITTVEVRWYSLDGTCLPLFITPVFFLFLLAVGCALMRRAPWAGVRRLALSQAELLTVYVFLVIGTLVAGHDMFQNLFGSIAHAARFATPENHWKDLFFRYLPTWLLVSDPTALKGFYQGGLSGMPMAYWGPFLKPLAWWTLLIGTLIGMCLCMNILLKRQWTEHERLAFPIVQLPVALTETPAGATPPLLRSRAMWVGFALAAAVDLVNGMHTVHPSWPYFEMVKQYHVGQFLTAPPWQAISNTNMSLYPFMIGLAFFLPLDLSFSCWFFFVARKLFQVTGSAMGWDGPGSANFPYFEQQASGAWIAWGLTIVWALRPQVVSAWRAAFHGSGTVARDEAARYRGAFIGLAVGAVILAWFSNRIGLTPWVAALFFLLYLLLALTITRTRAELGTPHEIYFVNPRLILVTLFGTQAIGAQSLTALSAMYWYNRCYRCHPMPNQLEAMKIGDSAGIRPRTLIRLLILAFVWGTLVAFWANMHVTFAAGATGRALGFKEWVGSESYTQLGRWLQTPERVLPAHLLYTAIGFILVLALRVLRGSFLWWPFHPAGYALAVSFAMDYFWFCFFVAWLAKLVIVRFGGMRLHNALIPFFLGLIVGDYVVGSLWALYGPLQQIQNYKIFI